MSLSTCFLVVCIDFKDFFLCQWLQPPHFDVFGFALSLLIGAGSKNGYHLGHKVERLHNNASAHQLDDDVVGVAHPGAVKNWESEKCAPKYIQYHVAPL